MKMKGIYKQLRNEIKSTDPLLNVEYSTKMWRHKHLRKNNTIIIDKVWVKQINNVGEIINALLK